MTYYIRDFFNPRTILTKLTDEQNAHNDKLKWMYCMGLHDTLRIMGNNEYEMRAIYFAATHRLYWK